MANPRLDIVKSKGALQISIIPAKYSGKKGTNGRTFIDVKKDGAVFLEFAAALNKKNENGNNLYDWQNKLTFALGINDIYQIVGHYKSWELGLVDRNVGNTLNLLHVSPGEEDSPLNKKVSITNGVDKYLGTWQVSISLDKARVTVPLSLGEYAVFVNLLEVAAPKILGLDLTMLPVEEISARDVYLADEI